MAKIKGKNFESVIVTESNTSVALDKKAQVFYGGEVEVGGETPSLLFGYGIVEDIATSPDISGNSYKIDGRVVGLFGAVTTYGDSTKISIGKTADLNAGLGIGIGAILDPSDPDALSGLSIGTVFAGGANSKITIAKGADIGGLLGVVALGADSSITNAGNIETGLLGMMAGDLSALGGGVVVGAAADPLPGMKLVNDGRIESAIGMIGLLSDGITLENSKSITAGIMGMGVFSMDGMQSTIINSGTVRVTVSLAIDPEMGLPIPISSAAIFGFMGAETLINTGKILGDVYLGAGNDVVDNTGGTIKGDIIGDMGDDTLIVGKATDVLVELDAGGIDAVKSAFSYTLAANVEYLFLTGKVDIDATGNAGTNVLLGNKGDNILTGLGDVDVFGFQTGGGKDTIADFGDGADVIDVSEWDGMADFATVLANATDKDGDVWIKLDKDVLIIADHTKAELVEANFTFTV